MTKITMSDETALPPERANVDQDVSPETEPLLQPVVAGGAVSDRLRGKVALVSGGDRGFGHAAAIALAHAGADVAILYLDGHEDAQETMREIVEAGCETMALTGDIGVSKFCDDAVAEVVKRFGRIDILVNAVGEHHDARELDDLEDAAIERSFRTNILGGLFLARAALPHLRPGAAIVNTALSAVVADKLRIDDAATQGAIVAFTRALAASLAARRIRVNAVAPRRDCPPDAAAPLYVFLAAAEARLMTGETLHPDDGAILDG